MSDHDADEYASPACSRHELDPGYLGAEEVPRSTVDVTIWRRAQRQRLVAARAALAAETRARCDGIILAALEVEILAQEARTVSLYWPIRGEPNVQPLFARLVARGVVTALPVVVEQDQPLQFRSWAPGEALAPGVWGIPVPARENRMIPELIVAPVVGFDARGFRLGYGGGYYDRTLAALAPRPYFLGVGYAESALESIYPQPYDQRLDAIVTEDGVRRFRPE